MRSLGWNGPHDNNNDNTATTTTNNNNNHHHHDNNDNHHHHHNNNNNNYYYYFNYNYNYNYNYNKPDREPLWHHRCAKLYNLHVPDLATTPQGPSVSETGLCSETGC